MMKGVIIKKGVLKKREKNSIKFQVTSEEGFGVCGQQIDSTDFWWHDYDIQ